MAFRNLKFWLGYGQRLRDGLLNPHMDQAELDAALSQARARQPVPVLWLIGKTQAGKTSIIRALTGSPTAEIGNGFQPCTRTAQVYDFPAEAPIARFLDTRGLGEVAYDPGEDLAFCEAQAHLVLGVMKAGDLNQAAVFDVLRAVRRRHPDWPLLIAQTTLHELYPFGDPHPQPYPFDLEPWPDSVPVALQRALRAQRTGLGKIAGAPPLWIPLDFTLPEDGYEPVDYGLEALWSAIESSTALGLEALLRGEPEVRDAYARAAHPHITGYAVAAAGVGALPLVDLVAVPAVQAKLLHTLAELYGQTWDRRMVLEFLGLLGVGAGLSYLMRMAGRELIKLTPWLGQTLGAVWGATASGATTYALGKAASYYFAGRHRGVRVDAEQLRQIYQEALAKGAHFLRALSPTDKTPS